MQLLKLLLLKLFQVVNNMANNFFEKQAITYKMAVKNLTRQKRRNIILAIAIAIGFFLVTSLDGFVSGMANCLEDQFTQLMGGSVLINGLEKIPAADEDGKSKVIHVVRDGNYIKNLLEKSDIKYTSYSCYSTNSGSMIFEGNKSLVQLYGRDLTDPTLIESFQFISGGMENVGPNTVIISEKTAEAMNLEVGDQFIFQTSTVYGQRAVTDLTVAGIIKANSFINTIQAYTDIGELNTLIGLPEDGFTTFSVYLTNKNKQVSIAAQIEDLIRKDGQNVTSRITAMQTNPSNISRGFEKQLEGEENQWEGTKWSVEALYDSVAGQGLKKAVLIVHIVTTIVLIVILLIVMVGISNTYRMILYERIREIGTMRALGMEGKMTSKLFTTEAVILCIFGAVSGLIISVVLLQILSMIPFNIEILSLFMRNGHFTYLLSPVSIIIQYVILIVLTTLAVLGSAKQAARMNPAEALRTFK